MHWIDTKLIDVFVSYSRADSVRVESWIKRLRQGGIEVWYDEPKDNGPSKRQVPAALAAKGCEVLIWFVSKFAQPNEEAGRVATQALKNGKAVVLVVLDTATVPAVFDVSLRGVTVVELLLLGRQPTWEAMLAAIRAQGVPWVSPKIKRRPSKERNVRRSAAMAQKWLWAAIASVVLLVAGSLALTQLKHKPAEIVVAPKPPSPESEPKRLLTVTTDLPSPGVKAEPITLPSVAAPSIPTQLESVDPRVRASVDHVTACIEAATRENGLTDEQVEKIVGFFAYPLKTDGGDRTANGHRATTMNIQRTFPKFKETIHSIKAVGTDSATAMEVIVLSSYVADSMADNLHETGAVVMHYLVDLSDSGNPKITKMWREEQKRGQ